MPLGGRIKPENHGSATIGKAVKVVGKIYSKEDLIVDGDLEGTVEALEHKLTIGPNGTVHADVKAREVAVLGSLQGDVEATDKIEIRKEAKLVGNIKTASILIEDGADSRSKTVSRRPPQTSDIFLIGVSSIEAIVTNV
jgi:cytoskeletal protein CcmA (bactofilin family)